jgi:methylated-DNA-[protein]-cysteine S-methyltransferase
MSLYFCHYASPLGNLDLIAHEDALVAVLSQPATSVQNAILNPEQPILKQTQTQLAEYFNGERREFSIPLAPQGTDFQKRAWQALTTIPYGQTRSYTQQAEMLGNVKAVRAVGGANGKNPILIIIPCHRVIGANGKLVGFSSGIEQKQFLLKLEQQHS